ncbi:hypothetical protein [Propionivibrio sp.]|uniref:hypothetical protein n=1 Tax=Propionivibrio sp. TaxID=2212460 RepID=UPI0025D93A56|nr:hypothetical protein [Propionivibrio sp.]
MHQPTELVGRRRQARRSNDMIECLSSQMMGHRTDTAQALYHYRHLPVGLTWMFFKAAKPDLDMQADWLHDVGPRREQQRHLAVSSTP